MDIRQFGPGIAGAKLADIHMPGPTQQISCLYISQQIADYQYHQSCCHFSSPFLSLIINRNAVPLNPKASRTWFSK